MSVTPASLWPDLEQNLRAAISRAHLFKEEAVDEVIQRIKSQFSSIDDLRCFGSIVGGPPLSTEEKKALGLNTRRKYSKAFIQLVDVTCLEGRCPNIAYETTYQDALNRTQRRYELSRMKAAGIKELEILDPLGGAGCTAVGKVKKVHPIDDAPALPLPSCDMDYCRCCYIARVVGFS